MFKIFRAPYPVRLAPFVLCFLTLHRGPWTLNRFCIFCSRMNEFCQHSRNKFTFLFDVIKLLLSKIADLLGNDSLGKNFCRGSFCCIEEFYGLPGCSQFITFCNIAGNRNDGSPDLVSQCPIFSKCPVPGEFVQSYCKIFSPLPNFEVLEFSHFCPSSLFALFTLNPAPCTVHLIYIAS